MSHILSSFLNNSIEIRQKMLQDSVFMQAFSQACSLLKQTVDAGGTIYSCGNGGSACDAMHLTEELTARYKRERPGIRAMHFLDQGHTTCWANDYDYKSSFARFAETFCTDKDCLIGISTSGNSENVSLAVNAAKEKGTKTIGLLGKDGGKIKDEVDTALVVPSSETDRIQEVHITLIHAFVESLEC